MKLAKIKINAIGVNSLKGRLHEFVTAIDYDNSSTYRIILKNLELPAYIFKDTSGDYRAIHYCEQNENGVSCNHLNIFAYICQHLKEPIEKFSIKGSVKEMQTTANELEDKKTFVNVNTQFGLVSPCEDAEEEEAEEEKEIPSTAAPASELVEKRDWKKGWNSIKQYLLDEEISPTIINNVENRRKEIAETVPLNNMMIPPKKPHFPYHGPVLKRALRHVVSLNKDLLLIGGKGTGKDTLINTIAWILGLPTVLNVGSKDVTKEEFIGEPAFRNGESAFDLSLFAQAVKQGGVANLSEVNMLAGDVTSMLHPLTDENKQLTTPVGTIERNQNFIIIASMNVGNGYAGTRSLNDAFKDRFAVIRLPYVQEFEEMIRSKTGLHDTHGLTFLKQVKDAVDQLIQEENQGHAAATIRGYIDAANYFLQIGISNETKEEVIEDYIINKVENTDEYMALRQVIRDGAWSSLPITEEEQQYINGENI